MSEDKKNEKSVLISLDSLSADAPNHGAPLQDIGEESGLIDLGALGGGFEGGGNASAPTFSFEAAAPGRVKPVRRGGGGLMLAIGALILAGGGVAAGWYFSQQKPAPENVVEPGKPIATGPAKGAEGPKNGAQGAGKPALVAKMENNSQDAGANAAPTAAAKADAAAVVAAKADAGPAKVAAAAPETTKAKRKRRRRRRRKGKNRGRGKTATATPNEDAPVAANRAPSAPAVATKPKRKSKETSEVDALLGALDGKTTPSGSGGAIAAPASDPMLPASLNRRQILGVVKRGVGKVRGCKAQQPDAKGTVMVKMIIAKSGNVSSAQVKSGPFKGTPFGACVERTVKVFRFPQFSGKAMHITMPFSI